MKPTSKPGQPAEIEGKISSEESTCSAAIQNTLLTVDRHTTTASGNLALMQKIDAVCIQLEEDWSTQRPTLFVRYLENWEEPERSILLEELLRTDMELRAKTDDSPSVAGYVQELPNDRALIEDVISSFNDVATINLQQLVARVRSSGLLETHEIDSVLREAGISADTEATTGSVLRLKDCLISVGGLTNFQVATMSEREPKVPLILGDYIILDHVGTGGMGMVLKAVHRRMKRIVALKVLPANVAGSTDRVQRFQREVEAAARLSHPNIVTAYDAGQDKEMHYLTMELVDGQDLSRHVKLHGPMALKLAVDVIIQAAEGLKYAHENHVIHRDIKPANVLLGENGTVKILDMGLARLRSDEQPARELAETELTGSGMVMGTVDYASPEQTQDARQADARSDIYSLGCTFHYLLTGQRMFHKESAVDRIIAHRQQAAPELPMSIPGLSPQLEDCFQRMVAKEPADRFQNMDEVISALRHCIDRDERKTQSSKAQAETETLPAWLSASWMFAAVIILFLGVGLADWAFSLGVLIRVETPGGTIVLEVEQPELDGAEIIIDEDKTVTIKIAGDPQEVRVEAKAGTLHVSKAGFQTKSFAFQIDDATGKALVKVHLEKLSNLPVTPPPLDSDAHALVGNNEPDAWIGLVQNPERLSGGKQWQLITREPRGIVTSLTWSPDDKFIACGATDGHVRIYESDTFRLTRVIPGQETVSWSPNGNLIATTNHQTHYGPADSTELSIWNAATGTLVATFGPFEKRINDFAWSHDGVLLLLAMANEVVVVNSSNATVELRIEIAGAWDTKVGWTSDDSQILVAGLGKGIEIYDAGSGSLHRSIEIPTATTDLAFSPNGQRAVLVIDKAQLRELDLNSQKFGFTINAEEPNWWPRTVVWSNDSSAVFMARRDSQLLRIDADSGTAEQLATALLPGYRNTPEYGQGGFAIAVSPIGSRLAAGFWDGAISTWGAERTPTAGIDRSDAVHFESVEWSSDGEQCLAGTVYEENGGNWYLSSQNRRKPGWSKTDIGGWSAPAWDLGSNGVSKPVALWDWIDSRPTVFIEELKKQDLPKLTVVVPSPDGRQLAVQAENRVMLIDPKGQVTGAFATVNNYLLAKFDWAPNSKRAIISWRGDDKVYEWKIGNNQPQQVVDGVEGYIIAISFSPNGEWVALTDKSNALLIYRASDWSLHSKRSFETVLEDLSWGPDSKQLATIATDGSLRIHSIEGDVSSVIGCHSEFGKSLAWHPTKPLIVSVGHDETIRMIDANTKELISTAYISGPDKEVTISASGELLRQSSPEASRLIVRIQETEDGRTEIEDLADTLSSNEVEQ